MITGAGHRDAVRPGGTGTSSWACALRDDPGAGSCRSRGARPRGRADPPHCRSQAVSPPSHQAASRAARSVSAGAGRAGARAGDGGGGDRRVERVRALSRRASHGVFRVERRGGPRADCPTTRSGRRGCTAASGEAQRGPDGPPGVRRSSGPPRRDVFRAPILVEARGLNFAAWARTKVSKTVFPVPLLGPIIVNFESPAWKLKLYGPKAVVSRIVTGFPQCSFYLPGRMAMQAGQTEKLAAETMARRAIYLKFPGNRARTPVPD